MPTQLAQTLRTATRTEHERAEAMPFVAALMAGRLPLTAYADLLAQHRVVYAALEAAEPSLRADATGRTLVVDGLARSAAIEADLATLVGPAWRARVRTLPATARYAARLREVVGTWVGGYAAHAYTRYLGDLSGGLAIRSVLRRHHGLGDDALHFLTFPAMPQPKLVKDDYRARLDALPFDDAEQARVADEARLAFRLNAAVLADLGAVHLDGPEPADAAPVPAVSTAGSPAP